MPGDVPEGVQPDAGHPLPGVHVLLPLQAGGTHQGPPGQVDEGVHVSRGRERGRRAAAE